MTVTFKKVVLYSLLLLILLVLSALSAIYFGPAKISPLEILGIFQHGASSSTQGVIILSIRLPRIIMAGLIGAALAAAGSIFQALLRNPLADPYVLGISSGAAVGAISVIVLGYAASGWGIPLFSFVGALLSIGLVFYVGRVREKVQTNTLLLAGVIVNSFFSAMIMLLLSISSSQDLHGIIYWLMGDLGQADYDKLALILPYILGGVGVLYLYTPKINLLLLGEDEAMQLGVEVERVKKTLYLLASLITAAAVSVCGIIGFVGLIIPHIVRLLWGNDYRLLLPASFLMGGSFLIIADTIARTIISPVELPVGVVTAICGTPFFIYLLRNRRCL